MPSLPNRPSFSRSIARSALLGAFLFLSGLSSSRAEEVSVYLLLGQSNMDGRGKISDLPDSRKGQRDGVLINYHNSASVNSGGWQTLAPGYSMPPNSTSLPAPTFGLELGFADRLQQRGAEQNIALLKVSKGGTSLYEDWNPGNRSGQSKGAMYALLESALTSATIELEQNGDTLRFGGVIWHQGEADAAAKRTSAQYEADLKNFIGEVRSLTSQPDLAFVMGEIPDVSRRETIRSAQVNIVSTVPQTALVSANGLTLQDDGVHLDANGLIVFGERYADATQSIVPEPATVGMALLPSLILLARRRPR